MKKTERKTVAAALKAAGDDGSFEAVIATFGVVDHDGDILDHGAFASHPVPVLPAHDAQHVPLGKALIEERGRQAVAVGQFNLDIPAARDWHSALKFDLANVQPPVQEWSWGFRVAGPDGARPDQVDGLPVRRLMKLDQREVSPVLRGASIGTGTLAAKNRKAMAAHDAETSTAPWNGPANERQLKEGSGADAFAIQPAGDEKGLLLHHFIGEGGAAGAASTRACLAGIAQLKGRGGAALPLSAEQRQAVYDHLAGHLRDADIEPPELPKEGAGDLVGLKLTDELQLVTWDVEAVLLRVLDVMGDRPLGKDAKGLAVAMAGQFGQLDEVLHGLRAMAEGMAPQDQAAKEAARFLALDALRHGVKA